MQSLLQFFCEIKDNITKQYVLSIQVYNWDMIYLQHIYFS